MFYEVEFKEWLLNNTNSKNLEDTCSHYIRDARAIERDYSISIDEEFKKDKCENLQKIIKETPTNYAANRKGRHDLIIRNYIDFKNSTYNFEKDKFMQDEKVKNIYTPPLNRIFYGPPGTGKTYHTINAALEVLIPEKAEEFKNIVDKEERRNTQKEAFDELLDMGKIRFVTFHQSFSYEDFVEGIRPDVEKEEGENSHSLSYDVKSGIFKEICEAAEARVIQTAGEKVDLTGKKVWKMSLGDSYKDINIYEYCLKNNQILMGWGGDLDFSNDPSRERIVNSLQQQWGTTPAAGGMLFHFINTMQIGDIVVIPEGLTKVRAVAEIIEDYKVIKDDSVINYEGSPYMQSRGVRWLCQFDPPMPLNKICKKRFSQRTLYNFALSEKERAELQLAISPQNDKNTPNNYVLIIDEINRGNISGIFGELITLIEPSKRLGAEEELQVTLPYSRDTFGVPNNLYIIGTMNTADRSLTGLDIALRRRFTFVEMPPDYELLEDKEIEGTKITVADLLLAMNERIEFLLGRDYCLGHAAFMHLKDDVGITVEDLKPIFKNTIIPLLQEYFFEDWRKIHLALNDHKKDEQFRFIKEKKISQDILDDEEFSKSPRRLWEINEDAFEKIESYVKINNSIWQINLESKSTKSVNIGLPDFAEIDNFLKISKDYQDDTYYLLAYKNVTEGNNYKIYVDGIEANSKNENSPMSQIMAAKAVIKKYNLNISLIKDSGVKKTPNELIREILNSLEHNV